MMNDDQFENYLREFEPRKPRTLPIVAGVAPMWRRLAAAIALFFVGTISFLGFSQHKGLEVNTSKNVKETPMVVPTASMTVLAFENPRQFESALDARASQTLQRFDRKDSALRVLGKE